MPLVPKWKLQKTNVKTDITLKRVYKNKKHIKIGDVVRLFLYKSKTCNELDYIIRKEDTTENIVVDTVIGCNLIYKPMSETEWSASTTFTDDKLNVIMQYDEEQKCYIIELCLDNAIASNDNIYNFRDNIIKLKTIAIPDKINVKQIIANQATIEINLEKNINTLEYHGDINFTLTIDNKYYKSRFVPTVLYKYYFVYESLYHAMRVCYKITKKQCKTRYTGIFVDDYLSKDDKNLIPPNEIEFNYQHIFQFVESKKKVEERVYYTGKETRDCTNWHGQCYDLLARKLIKPGDTVRCRGVGINETLEDKIVDEYCSYFLILEIDGINIKGELQDPYSCGSTYNTHKPLQYSAIKTTINCISEIPLWFPDEEEAREERTKMFENLLTSKGYMFTGCVIE